MAIVNEPCPSCGTPTDVHIGQAIGFDDRLVWSRGMNCASCGYSVEADGSGFPPEHYREAILAQDGSWSVTIADSTQVSSVALVLKEALGMDRAAALRAARAIPGPVWTGSRAEAEWLRRQLARRAVVAILECVDGIRSPTRPATR
jgi:hypothetical protein